MKKTSGVKYSFNQGSFLEYQAYVSPLKYVYNSPMKIISTMLWYAVVVGMTRTLFGSSSYHATLEHGEMEFTGVKQATVHTLNTGIFDF